MTCMRSFTVAVIFSTLNASAGLAQGGWPAHLVGTLPATLSQVNVNPTAPLGTSNTVTSGSGVASSIAPQPTIGERPKVADLKLNLKVQILGKVQEQISLKRFPYYDHRPHETAEELAQILLEAAKQAAAKVTQDDPLGQDTAALRKEVFAKINALISARESRRQDWEWIAKTAEAIEKTHINKSLEGVSNLPSDPKDNVYKNVTPNPTRWGHLAYVYQEFGEAAAELAQQLKLQRDAEIEVLANYMARGGTFSSRTASGGWMTVPAGDTPKRRKLFQWCH